MKISTKFTLAVHTMLCIAYFQNSVKLTSDFIASSTNVNPVIIREILGLLQDANLVVTKSGVGGSSLARAQEKITLLDIYKAVNENKENSSYPIFNFHPNPNPECPVGSKIHTVLDPALTNAQKALEKELSKTNLKKLREQLSK